MHTITSPTGVTVTQELTSEQLHNLQQLNYFTVKNAHKDRTFEDIEFTLDDKKPAKPRVHIGGDTCISCEG